MLERVIKKVKQGKRLNSYCQLIISDDYYLVYDLRCGLLALWSGDRGYDIEGFRGKLDCVIGFVGDVYECEKLVEIYDLIYEGNKATKDSKICENSFSS